MSLPSLSISASVHSPSRERLRGIASMIAAVFVFAIMDALMKRLSSHYGPLQVSCMRCLSSLVFLIATIASQRSWRRLRATQPLLHVMRGALGIGMLASFVYAVHLLTVAQTYSLFLVAPLLMSIGIFEDSSHRCRNNPHAHRGRCPTSHETDCWYIWEGVHRITDSQRNFCLRLDDRISLVRLSHEATAPTEHSYCCPRGRNQDLWGPDAYVFRPERWFEMNEQVESPVGVYGNLYGHAWCSDGVLEY